jgi:acyl-CoA synthetase (AMP-forming)/AMP-acid ligase II
MNSLPETITELLFQDAEESRPAGSWVEPKGHLIRRFDTAEMAHQAALLTRALTATGIRRGNKIAFCCRSSTKTLSLMFAAKLGGALCVVLPEDATLEEKLHILSISRAEALVVDRIDQTLPLLEHIRNLPQLRQLVVLEDEIIERPTEILCTGWQELLTRGEKQADRSTLLRQAIMPAHDALMLFHRDAEKKITGHQYTHQEVMEALQTLLKYLPESKKIQQAVSLASLNHLQGYLSTALIPLVAAVECKIIPRNESWKLEMMKDSRKLLFADAALIQQKYDALMEAIGGLPQWRQSLWHALTAKDNQSLLRRWLAKRLYAKLLKQAIGFVPLAVLASDAALPEKIMTAFTLLGIRILPTPKQSLTMIQNQSVVEG